MSKLTERLLQVGAVVFILFYSWNLLSSTVVYIIRQNQTIAELQYQLKQQVEKK